MTRGSFCTWSMSPSASTRLVQHGDAPRDRSHEIHVVLDHDHRMLARERQQQLRGSLGLLRRHAGDRLVHEQQLRLLHQQHADLEPLFLAVRQRARHRRAAAARPIISSMSSIRSAAPRVRRGEQRRPERLVAPERELEVLEHRQVLEDRGLLKLAADARPAQSPARTASAD